MATNCAKASNLFNPLITKKIFTFLRSGTIMAVNSGDKKI
jgi:hypothetical protein